MKTVYVRFLLVFITFSVSFTGNSQIKESIKDDFMAANRCVEKYYETDSLNYIYKAISYWDLCISKHTNTMEASISKCIWLCELKRYEEAEETLEAVPDSVIRQKFGDAYKYPVKKLFRIMKCIENRQETEAIKNAKEAYDFLEFYMNEHKTEIREFIRANKQGEKYNYDFSSFLMQYFYFHSLVYSQIETRIKLMKYYDNMNGEMAENLYLYLYGVWNHDICHFNGLI